MLSSCTKTRLFLCPHPIAYALVLLPTPSLQHRLCSQLLCESELASLGAVPVGPAPPSPSTSAILHPHILARIVDVEIVHPAGFSCQPTPHFVRHSIELFMQVSLPLLPYSSWRCSVAAVWVTWCVDSNTLPHFSVERVETRTCALMLRWSAGFSALQRVCQAAQAAAREPSSSVREKPFVMCKTVTSFACTPSRCLPSAACSVISMLLPQFFIVTFEQEI